MALLHPYITNKPARAVYKAAHNVLVACQHIVHWLFHTERTLYTLLVYFADLSVDTFLLVRAATVLVPCTITDKHHDVL